MEKNCSIHHLGYFIVDLSPEPAVMEIFRAWAQLYLESGDNHVLENLVALCIHHETMEEYYFGKQMTIDFEDDVDAAIRKIPGALDNHLRILDLFGIADELRMVTTLEMCRRNTTHFLRALDFAIRRKMNPRELLSRSHLIDPETHHLLLIWLDTHRDPNEIDNESYIQKFLNCGTGNPLEWMSRSTWTWCYSQGLIDNPREPFCEEILEHVVEKHGTCALGYFLDHRSPTVSRRDIYDCCFEYGRRDLLDYLVVRFGIPSESMCEHLLEKNLITLDGISSVIWLLRFVGKERILAQHWSLSLNHERCPTPNTKRKYIIEEHYQFQNYPQLLELSCTIPELFEIIKGDLVADWEDRHTYAPAWLAHQETSLLLGTGSDPEQAVVASKCGNWHLVWSVFQRLTRSQLNLVARKMCWHCDDRDQYVLMVSCWTLLSKHKQIIMGTCFLQLLQMMRSALVCGSVEEMHQFCQEHESLISIWRTKLASATFVKNILEKTPILAKYYGVWKILIRYYDYPQVTYKFAHLSYEATWDEENLVE